MGLPGWGLSLKHAPALRSLARKEAYAMGYSFVLCAVSELAGGQPTNSCHQR
jgi:hypothetical protein